MIPVLTVDAIPPQLAACIQLLAQHDWKLPQTWKLAKKAQQGSSAALHLVAQIYFGHAESIDILPRFCLFSKRDQLNQQNFWAPLRGALRRLEKERAESKSQPSSDTLDREAFNALTVLIRIGQIRASVRPKVLMLPSKKARQIRDRLARSAERMARELRRLGVVWDVSEVVEDCPDLGSKRRSKFILDPAPGLAPDVPVFLETLSRRIRATVQKSGELKQPNKPDSEARLFYYRLTDYFKQKLNKPLDGAAEAATLLLFKNVNTDNFQRWRQSQRRPRT